MRIRHIEAVEQRIARVASHKDVDAATITFGRGGTHLPSAARSRHPFGQFRKHARPAHLRIEQPGHGQGAIAYPLALQALPWVAPEELIDRVHPGGLLSRSRGLLIGARSHDEAVQIFQTPAVPHQLPGQPIEQLRVGGALAFQAEIARARDDPLAEVMLPDPVHQHAGRERIFRVGQQIRQGGPAPGAFGGG